MARMETGATLLAIAGAALAGAGVGLLMSRPAPGMAQAVLTVGIVAHVTGMVGRQPMPGGSWPPWLRAAQIIAWGLIAMLVAALALGWRGI